MKRLGSAPHLVAAALAAAWVLTQLHAPLVEDSLFWWVPKGLLVAQNGPGIVFAGELPRVMQTAGLPHQWQGGLPDYGHPPLWYWWLGLFLWVSPTVVAVHLAALLPAVLAAVGFAELGLRLGQHPAHRLGRWSGLAVLCLPPVLAQLLRADLDLPLLAIVPWALVALIRARWTRFALLGLLAPWVKEPGVLLVVPALWVALRERRWRWQALTPLLGLALWGLVFGRLAQPERLPFSVGQYIRDIGVALQIVFFQQGRWLLWLGLPWVWRRLPRQVATVFALAWLLFFAAVGFFATRGGLDSLTHVRYFLPGMAVAAVVLTQRWPALALPGLLWLFARSPYGPEASLYGVNAARAERDAAPWIASQVQSGREVWVGSYQAAGLSQRWAGAGGPVDGVQVYDMDTDPSEIPSGAALLVAAYGEPAGRLRRGLHLEEEARWEHHGATVLAYRVR